MKSQRHQLTSDLLVALWLLATAGCGGGPEIGQVEGVVTLNGQPLANAEVEFEPFDGDARSSYGGKTDATGRYQLYLAGDQTGAEPGDYTVRITVPEPGDEPTATPTLLVPATYNVQSELTATVNVGSNTIDFPLTSQGQTVRR